MKKLGAFLVVAVVCFVAGRLSKQDPVSAQGGGAGDSAPLPPCQDINGDGRSDVSDAVFFLQWKFQGGPEPECPWRNGQPVGLPDTGQTDCYDADGWRIPSCASATCPGQDGFYATGCPMEGRFIDNKDGTVTDTCTGLMWLQNTADTNGDELGNWNDMVPWCAALHYCEDLSFAGHDDWRLPNVRELQSLVHYARCVEPVKSCSIPTIDPIFRSLAEGYWSSTSYAPLFHEKWVVLFRKGMVVESNTARMMSFGDGTQYYVRAVRTIQPGE